MDIDWPTFVGVVLLAYVIPGPDFAVILRASTRHRRAGVAAALGAQVGLCVHMLIAVLGLSLLLARSADALTAIRLLGAAYLVYLGVRIVLSSRRGAADDDPAEAPVDVRASFVQGFLTNVSNPKAILFFASVLPQFVVTGGSTSAQVLVLGTVDVLIGLVVWAGLVVVGVRLAAVLRRPGVRRAWDRVTGGVLVGLGGAIGAGKV